MDPTRTTGDGEKSKVKVRRSIVIGLGGTGRNVCTQLKSILIDNHDNNAKRFPYVRLLSIDTDSRKKSTENRSGETVRLDHTELMPLKIPPALDKRKFSRFMSDYVMTRILPHVNETGAGRCRPVGHAFLVTNWGQIRDRIVAIYRDLHSADLADLLHSDPNFADMELDRSRIDIYVTGNLVSGTGSGMSLGMGYLLRDLVSQLSQDGMTQIMTEGIFTTCGLFALGRMDGKPSEYAVNCYASLLELNHFSTPNVYDNPLTCYGTGYDDIILPKVAREQPPYDEVQLLNPSHCAAGGLSNEQFEPQIAAMLALRIGSHVGMTATARLVDERRNDDEFDMWGNRRFCRAWGAVSFRSSGQDVLDLAVALAADEVIDALTGENVRSAMNRKDVAYDILTSIGFGYAEDAESGKRNTTLLTSLLTPTEAVAGGTQGVNVLDSLQEMVTKAFPQPTDDREYIRGLPILIDRKKGELLTRVKGLVSAVITHNRRAASLRIREAVTKRLEELADFSTDGRGSLDDAIAVIDLLVGVESDLDAGLLRRDSAQYQLNGQAALAEAAKGRTLAESGEQAVRVIAGLGGKFEYQALIGAWDNFVKGLIQQVTNEARQAVLGEARTILNGDTSDRDEFLRTGLIKALEKLRVSLRAARQQLKNLDLLFEQRSEKLTKSLARFAMSAETSLAEARDLKNRLLDGEMLRLLAAEVVGKVIDRPHLAGTRYERQEVLQADYSAVDRKVRERIQVVGADGLARSIDDNPDFDGRLTGFLDRAEPAIQLNPNLEADRQLAYISVPKGVVAFRQKLIELDWLGERSGDKKPGELIEERPGDNDPRVDVITARLQFSPAAILGIDDWGTRYDEAAESAAGRRNVHTVADPEGGKNLIFEPLGTTEARLQVAFLIAYAMNWLQESPPGSVYVVGPGQQGRTSRLLKEEMRCQLSRGLNDPGFFREFTQPVVQGSGDPEGKRPIFLHALIRFRDLMRQDDNERERADSFARLVIGLAQMVYKVGTLHRSPLLPKPKMVADFRRFEHALSCLLIPLGLYEDLLARVDALPPDRVPELGETDKLTAAPPQPSVAAPPPPANPDAYPIYGPAIQHCPRGHQVAAGAKFCGECGARIEESEAVCPHCSTKLSPGQRFCSNCGQPQAA